MIVKVPIKWMTIAGNQVLTPDLRGVEGAEFATFIEKNDTHMIVEVQGNFGTISVPTYNSKEEAIKDLSAPIKDIVAPADKML